MKKHRLFTLLLLVVLAIPAKLLWDVYRIPDYRKGEAVISSSPDGMYQGINMYVPHATPYDEGWQAFSMNLSGYEARIIMGLVDSKTGQILAYVPIKHNDFAIGEGGSWTCIDIKKGPCVEYQSNFQSSVLELPPKHWHRLVAWAAAAWRGLGASDFVEIEYRESGVFYPGEHEQ